MKKWEKALMTSDGYEPDSFVIKELLEQRKNEVEGFTKESDIECSHEFNNYQMSKHAFQVIGLIRYIDPSTDEMDFLKELNSRNCFDFDCELSDGDKLTLTMKNKTYDYSYWRGYWQNYQVSSMTPPLTIDVGSGVIKNEI
jgi:hypothetical protein